MGQTAGRGRAADKTTEQGRTADKTAGQPRKVIEMGYIDQSGRWPTGCESVSAVMVLNYLGIDISVDDFIEKYIPCQPFKTVDGVLFGADPHICFAGSPYDENAFGCYAPVILSALERVFKDYKKNFAVKDESGTPVESLIEMYVNRGFPVIFWACIDMKMPVEGPGWKLLSDGTDFMWTSNEHCMVLAGADEEKYYFYDPWQNHGLTGWDKGLVTARHEAQNSMSVAVFPL